MTVMTKIRHADFTPEDWERFERTGMVERWREAGVLDESEGRSPGLGPEWRTVALSAAFDPTLHPRHPAGSDRGGEFAAKMSQAFHDKIGNLVYLDNEGNYRYRKAGKPGGPITDWNDAVKEQFGTDQIAFHNAANEFIRPLTVRGGAVTAAWDPSKHPRNPATGRDRKESPQDGGKFRSSKGGATEAPAEETEDGAPVKDKLATELLGDFVDTQQKYKGPVRVGENGYTEERVETVIDPYVEYEISKGTPGQKNPETLFLAGGSGSGKTTILNSDVGATMRPDGAVIANPDAAKIALPEYRKMVEGGSQYAAWGAHEESSDMAKAVLGEAVAGDYNAVVDGTGDSGAKKFMAKLDAQKALGRNVKVLMADIPTDEAIRRADARAMDPKSESFGRFVNHAEIRKIHKSVAQNHLVWRDQVDDWEVYANDNGPKLIARRVGGGKIEILDEARYQQALDKAGE